MKKMKKTELVNRLNEGGFKFKRLDIGDGGEAIVIPQGARVIGLYISGLDENLLWLPKAWKSTAELKAYLKSGDWNLGGDRTWLAPELDYNVSDGKHFFEKYAVQPDLDPGRYVFKTAAPGKIILEQKVTLKSARPGKKIKLFMKIEFAKSENPFHHNRKHRELMKEVNFCGWTMSSTITEAGKSGAVAGLWRLMQLRAGGEVIIPCTAQPVITDYFEPAGPEHLRVSENRVMFKIDGKERHKIGINAMHLTGRVGYRYPLGDGSWVLIVRNFFCNPSGWYVDEAMQPEGHIGDAVQCYNDSGNLGGFGEMEYHAPAIGKKTGLTTYTDTSSLWLFKSRDSHLLNLIETLIL